jgi:hypothetical protein
MVISEAQPESVRLYSAADINRKNDCAAARVVPTVFSFEYLRRELGDDSVPSYFNSLNSYFEYPQRELGDYFKFSLRASSRDSNNDVIARAHLAGRI